MRWPLIALAVLTLAAYAGVFVNLFVYDDSQYVVGNPALKHGLTVTSLRWALSSFYASNWHPLTWLSHALDISLFGLAPAGHHAVNLFLHILVVILLFIALRLYTGAVLSSAIVTALFAVHPLHVESVAWISERKDVLSGVFFMLTILVWLGYLRKPVRSRHLAALACFAMGLMAKPMLVTLPLVLLLLDFWPLGRLRGGWRGEVRRDGPGLLVEKAPFFAMAVLSSIITIAAQKAGPLAPLTDIYSFTSRISNALHSYVVYLLKTLYPAGLSVFYPHPGSSIPLWRSIMTGAFLAGVTWLVLARRWRLPYLAVGWFWFLGMLLPVIGLVQVGSQGMADRYTYLPSVGLFLAAVWGARDLTRPRPRLRSVIALAVTAAVCALAMATCQQVTYWRDNKTLFGHALKVNPENALAHNTLGVIIASEGSPDQALWHLREAVRIWPEYGTAYYNLGNLFAGRGDFFQAIAAYRKCIALQPDYQEAHNNLGSALFAAGFADEAIAEFKAAIRLKPDEVTTRYNLGSLLEARGLSVEAADQYREALRIDPGDAEARAGLERLTSPANTIP